MRPLICYCLRYRHLVDNPQPRQSPPRPRRYSSSDESAAHVTLVPPWRCPARETRGRFIFDWGAWNMIKTNKSFIYVFNTMNEDRKVAKVLSGWKPSKPDSIAD